MSVFVEMVVDDFQKVFKDSIDQKRVSDLARGGAGEANVRRPLRGLEVKNDTYAVMRILKADGTEIPLFDSSSATGESTRYANFLLQSVQDSRMEKHQIVETFGDAYIFFFGESPRFIDVSAILINSLDFNWRAEWWKNYELYLRGTRLVEMGARSYLFYDENIVEGYILQAQIAESSDNPRFMTLNFKMFVTNYANISLVGDPNFPIRAVGDDQGVDITSADTVSVPRALTDNVRQNLQDINQKLVQGWVKSQGAIQIQQELRSSQSLLQAQNLQKDYALQQLGFTKNLSGNLLGTIGKQMLSDIKRGNFTGTVSAISRPITTPAELVAEATKKAYADVAQTVDVERQRFANESEDRLAQLEGREPRPHPALLPSLLDRGPADNFNLADVLRRSLFYASPYPGQNIQEFIQNATASATGSLKNQPILPPPVRTLPLRGLISDNKDEFTSPAAGEGSGNPFLDKIRGPVAAESDDPYNEIVKQMGRHGVEKEDVTPGVFSAWGLLSWSPGQGFQSDGGSGSIPGAGFSLGGSPAPFASGLGGTGRGEVSLDSRVPSEGNGVVLGFGIGFNAGFNRSLGATAGIGGAYGGSMGGSIGPGIGGAYGGWGAEQYGNPEFQQYGNPVQQQLNQNPFGLPTGNAAGLGYTSSGPDSLSAHKYTAGFAPDGSFQVHGGRIDPNTGLQLSSNPQRSLFGGGSNQVAVGQFNRSIRGDGAFGIQTLPGSLT